MQRRGSEVFTCLAKGKSFISVQASWNQRLGSCKIRKLDNSCGTWLDNGDTWPTDGTVCLGRPIKLNPPTNPVPGLSARLERKGVDDPRPARPAPLRTIALGRVRQLEPNR